jgi:hypothetical protein
MVDEHKHTVVTVGVKKLQQDTYEVTTRCTKCGETGTHTTTIKIKELLKWRS